TGRAAESERLQVSADQAALAKYETRDGQPVWLVGTGSTSVEVSERDGVPMTAELVDKLTQYLAAPVDGVKPLPEEFLDLDGDGSAFDQADLDVAVAAYWNDERAGGKRKVWRYYHREQLGSMTHASDS